MNRLSMVLAIALTTAAAGAHAQQLRTYTQTSTGPASIPLGYPVPLPVESLTPVDGFRSYASLDARLQSLAVDSAELTSHDVGRTIANRPIWAYVVGDADGVDVEGRPEAAFFIRAATHAREWAAPEVSTGLIERMVGAADDEGLVRYLLDNTRLVIIPVHNVDGFLQTQRFPTQVLVGSDPTSPGWPRDGRMRRKNMRGVDEVLTTTADHLGGIDLNRNHPPFWATSSGNGSSPNPASLTYHGAGVNSEPETQAVVQAAELAPPSRIRLGVDVHTFSSVLFTVRTGRERLTAISNRLVATITNHHSRVRTPSGVTNTAIYQNVPEPIALGIGTASEYFGYTWLVPAWTLELEPGQLEGQQYGGLNTTHSGFILPASQARRVREAWAETHMVSFYFMAGAPHLARVRIRDATSGALLREERWTYDADARQRVRRSERPGTVQAGQRVRIELAFNKPMRVRDGGTVVPLAGHDQVPLQPTVTLLGSGGARTVLDVSAGQWQESAASRLRYRDDTFAFETVAPADGEFRLEVAAQDMVGLALDASPATPVDWEEGAWTAWEDAAGAAGDAGGADATTAFAVGGAASHPVALADGPRVVGEGDALGLVLERAQAGSAAIEIGLGTALQLAADPSLPRVRWAAGESGTRVLPFGVADDLQVQGDRDVAVTLTDVSTPTAAQPFAQLTARVLDNDRAGAGVMRVRNGAPLGPALTATSSAAGGEEIVLDGGAGYGVAQGTDARGLAVLHGPLQIHANGARIAAAGTASVPTLYVDTDADVAIDHALLDASPLTGTGAQSPFEVRGALRIARSDVDLGSPSRNAGTLRIERSLVRNDVTAPRTLGMDSTGTLSVAQSTVTGSVEWQIGGLLELLGTTMTANYAEVGFLDFEATPTAALRAGHALMFRNGGAIITPPSVRNNCDLGQQPATSLGYDIEDRDGCGFSQPTDGRLTDVVLGDFNGALAGFAPTGVAVDGGATAAQAGGTGCGAVDQRGAPRPQTLTAGAEPRCDVGAIELGINPYRGIWLPARAGHGVDLQTFGNQLLLAWYTYGDDGQPTAYQAIAPLTGRHWEATLRLARRDTQSGAITLSDVGRVTLDFDDDAHAALGWRFDARGTTGTERIQAFAFAEGEPRVEVTGLWYPPNEAGFGATITRRGEATAIGLYYYDASGTQRWALGTGSGADAVDVAMSSYTGFCPDCNAAQMPVQAAPAGRLLAHFLTPRRARLDMDLTYPGSAGGRWQRERADFVPLNDPVDNEAAANVR